MQRVAVLHWQVEDVGYISVILEMFVFTGITEICDSYWTLYE